MGNQLWTSITQHPLILVCWMMMMMNVMMPMMNVMMSMMILIEYWIEVEQ